MRFPSRLIQARKSQGLTQQGLADAAELHVNQIDAIQEALEGLLVKYEARHWTKAG